MDEVMLINSKIKLARLQEIASARFGNLVKAVVDIRQKIMAIGGEMHADEEKFLLESGSIQDDLWGINIYPDNPKESLIEFDSMINLRPRQNNRTRGIESPELQKKIIETVHSLIN